MQNKTEWEIDSYNLRLYYLIRGPAKVMSTHYQLSVSAEKNYEPSRLGDNTMSWMFQKTLQYGCLVFRYTGNDISSKGEFAYTTIYEAQIHQINAELSGLSS